jgi:hypothetical protein
MDDPDEAGPRDPRRRALLLLLLAAYAVPPIEWAFAAPADDAGRDAFLSASNLITGRSKLDPGLTSRLYEALVADDPQFPAHVQALDVLIRKRAIDPLQLQHSLDTGQPALAALPRKIATAWYVGIVGEDPNARCVAYETSLMSVAVSDHLMPPSYCSGPYGSWSQKPC